MALGYPALDRGLIAAPRPLRYCGNVPLERRSPASRVQHCYGKTTLWKKLKMANHCYGKSSNVKTLV
jgi:hypothetical protein